jgi:hypothetical protein
VNSTNQTYRQDEVSCNAKESAPVFGNRLDRKNICLAERNSEAGINMVQISKRTTSTYLIVVWVAVNIVLLLLHARTRFMDRLNSSFAFDAKMGHSLRNIYAHLHVEHKRFPPHTISSVAKCPPRNNKRSRNRLTVQKPARKQAQIDCFSLSVHGFFTRKKRRLATKYSKTVYCTIFSQLFTLSRTS